MGEFECATLTNMVDKIRRKPFSYTTCRDQSMFVFVWRLKHYVSISIQRMVEIWKVWLDCMSQYHELSRGHVMPTATSLSHMYRCTNRCARLLGIMIDSKSRCS